MSRPLRIEFPDAWYHVMNRARLGQNAFPARNDYSGFIALLMDASVRVAAYCLMPSHYQLLIQKAGDIKKAVCRHYEIREAALSKSRRGVENEARDHAIYLLRYVRGEGLENIRLTVNKGQSKI